MMCAKLSKGSALKHILVVSLTNIGDVVLTCPVIDILRRDFPTAKIDVMIGPKAVTLFKDNPGVIVKMFDKQASVSGVLSWFFSLVGTRYDLVVDLRHTMLPVFLMPEFATPVLFRKSIEGHKKDVHLNCLRQIYEFTVLARERQAVVTTKEDGLFFEREVAPFLEGKDFVLIAPGAASLEKRWHPEGFAAVADHLSASYKIVFVGDGNDAKLVGDIQGLMKAPSLSLAGRIHLRQLAYVLKKCAWALTHDSGVMHLASYFDVPQLVLWGPTDVKKYAPWSARAVVVRRNEKCIRCLDPKSAAAHNCMTLIEAADVIKAAAQLQK